jgi:hypothetical protein
MYLNSKKIYILKIEVYLSGEQIIYVYLYLKNMYLNCKKKYSSTKTKMYIPVSKNIYLNCKICISLAELHTSIGNTKFAMSNLCKTIIYQEEKFHICKVLCNVVLVDNMIYYISITVLITTTCI